MEIGDAARETGLTLGEEGADAAEEWQSDERPCHADE
jgi:hypothetical protein